MQASQPVAWPAPADPSNWPLLIGLLGPFRLLRAGQPSPVRVGAKTEALLCALALHGGGPLDREALVAAVWPGQDAGLAVQSLHSIVHSLHRSLGVEIGGQFPVVQENGEYRLNAEGGVGTDLACFDGLLAAADRHRRAGDQPGALALYDRAVALYRGELRAGSDLHALIERERVRALYLTVLARMADGQFAQGDFMACLATAARLLATDPCREDAHRLVMRCHVRAGERGQALRQYRVCEALLRAEFDAEPEPATRELFERIRADPLAV